MLVGESIGNYYFFFIGVFLHVSDSVGISNLVKWGDLRSVLPEKEIKLVTLHINMEFFFLFLDINFLFILFRLKSPAWNTLLFV